MKGVISRPEKNCFTLTLFGTIISVTIMYPKSISHGNTDVRLLPVFKSDV